MWRENVDTESCLMVSIVYDFDKVKGRLRNCVRQWGVDVDLDITI
jgi:hypothetical protein